MPLSDYTSYDPEFSDEQIAQCARLVTGLREINERVVRLSGSVEELSEAADSVEALLDSLAPVTRSRAMESFRYAFDAGAPNDVIPVNPATGEFNPIAPAMRMTLRTRSSSSAALSLTATRAGQAWCRAGWWRLSTTSSWPMR